MFKKFLLSFATSLFILGISVPVKAAAPIAPPVLPLIPTTEALANINAAQTPVTPEQAQALQAAQIQMAQEAQAAQIKAAQDAQAQAIKAAQDAQLRAAELASHPSSFSAATMANTYPDFVYVSISDQMAYFYRYGSLVTYGPCVTGNTSKGYNTTVGFHTLYFMDTNRTLHGSYGEAHVDYWMRFTKGGQGLHDAKWRRSFGCEIYKTNGSHGCVNLQHEVAKTIYANAYIGLPVIVAP